MDSIVLELERKATDKDADVAELVRMALVVATKLGLDEFRQWAEQELNGYRKEAEVPAYRQVNAEVKAHSPYHGWVPILFEDHKMAEAAKQARCRNSVGELQHMLLHYEQSGVLQQPYTEDVRAILMRGLDGPLVPTRIIAVSQVAGVLDAIRNAVLAWALRLEANDIIGDGMTFSTDEKQKAAQAMSVQINHFSGIMGNVSGGTIQIGDYAWIHRQLKERGIPQQERNELENLLDELKTASGENKRSLAKRGLEWVAKHAETLGKIASVIRPWFTST